MSPNHKILFEPVQIGPVVARNRFYQVPHCTGLGYLHPQGLARHRGIKAEGGWGVVCTEMCEIHPSSDQTGHVLNRLWDEGHSPMNRAVVEAIHEHDSLAAVELAHGGLVAANRYSRIPPLGPSGLGNPNRFSPVQAREVSRRDIRELRRWQREAALRARDIGFDIVYVYAAHNLALPSHFLSRHYNRRSDNYGGTFKNRARLIRELVEDTRDAVGETCAVALRFSVHDYSGASGIDSDGEGRELVALLAELPDLCDVNVSSYAFDAGSSRFAEEGHQLERVAFVKSLTTRPVVGVGRFTSPDLMVRAVKQGYLDLIGAARPSIADPFLPEKIRSGRSDDIRECIGCNICISADNESVPVRCTQNPTAGEEWRRNWHPERIEKQSDAGQVLVVGGGPAGLEAALVLGRRGYDVVLAEAEEVVGGRVNRESTLPGFSSWRRITDYRIDQLRQLPNVSIYVQSYLSIENVLSYGFEHVVIATGARWLSDGTSVHRSKPIPGLSSMRVLTPDDVLGAPCPQGAVIIYDADATYLGSALAEQCCSWGLAVTFITPAVMVSPWTELTLEQKRIQQRLVDLGVQIIVSHTLDAVIDTTRLQIRENYTGAMQELSCDALVLVTTREPDNTLYRTLMMDRKERADQGVSSISAIGDCNAPTTIAGAVFAGHRFGRDLGNPSKGHFWRERWL